MNKTLQLFALTLLEAARSLGDINADGERTTIKDVWEAYNRKVTPEAQLTWGDFKTQLRQAWEEGHVKLGGVAVPGADRIDDALEIAQAGARKGKVYKSFWRVIPRETIGPSIKKLRADLGFDFKDDVNQQLFDAMLRHQIYLMRLSGTVRNQTMTLLLKSEVDLAEKIKKRLAKHAGKPLTPAGLQQMQWLEKYVRQARMGAWSGIEAAWVREMANLAKSEVTTMAGVVSTVSPVTLLLNLPDARQLTKIATSNPFEGRTLKEWARDQAETDVRRILNSIRVGMVQGEGIDDIVRRVMGDAGPLSLTRTQSAAIVRTAVNFIGNEARAAFIDENADIFSGERYVATLDARTTAVCRANDGKVFPIGQGPRPPLHFNCRSLRVPTLSGEALGQRPARPHTERQLIKEFAEENDLSPRLATRDGLPRGYKGAYDAFARQRIRDLTTRVPSATSYQSWLETQSRAFQNDVLGPTRARLFREGKLTLDKFVDRDGTELSLAQLAKRHAEAFRAAGIESFTPKVYQTFSKSDALSVAWKNGKLTKAEFDAVSGYTSTTYSGMNRYLRGIDADNYSPQARERLLNEVKLIDQAIAKSKTPSDLKVYRYPVERGDTRSDYAKQIASLKVGDHLLEKSYLSTTLAKNYEHQPWDRPGGVRFEILVDKGTPSLNMMHRNGPDGKFMSSFAEKEFEIIFGRTSRMTVMDIIEDSSGGKTYVLKMDPP